MSLHAPGTRPAEHGSRALARGAANALSELPLFRGLDDACLEPLRGRWRTSRAKRGEFLFRPGDDANCVFAILSGTAKVFHLTPRGDERVIYFVGEGEVLGEPAVLVQEPYELAAQATSKCTVLMLPSGPMLELIAHQPEVARRLIRGLAARFSRTLREALEYGNLPTQERLARYLLSLAGEARATEIQLPASKGDIASLLCMSRETLSRAFARLQTRRCIQLTGKHLRFTDAGALAALLKNYYARPRGRFRRGEASLD